MVPNAAIQMPSIPWLWSTLNNQEQILIPKNYFTWCQKGSLHILLQAFLRKFILKVWFI